MWVLTAAALLLVSLACCAAGPARRACSTLPRPKSVCPVPCSLTSLGPHLPADCIVLGQLPGRRVPPAVGPLRLQPGSHQCATHGAPESSIDWLV